MFKNLLNRLAGNPYERELSRYKAIVAQVAALEPRMQSMSDEELRGLTARFRAEIQEQLAGYDIKKDREAYLTAEQAALDAILPEAFAAVREAAVRTIGLRPYDVQIIGGVVLHEGKIAEMRTGEGKTLVASLPLYLNALAGRGAHLVTVNDYLARRDGGWMGPIYHLLGLSVGVIGKEGYSAIFDPDYVDPGGDLEDERLVHWRPTLRRECYRADITYGTAPEFGFDYLRDNTALDIARTVQRGHPYAIVDEVDSVLIDGARTPLIISGPAGQASSIYQRFAEIVEKARLRRNTTNLDEEEPDGDYVLDDRTQTVSLTERGIEKIEALLPEIDTASGQSLYDPQYYELVHYLENALKAKYVFHRDKEYIVQDGHVILIDQTTGRPMPSRRYSEGLHQAIEAKEGVRVRREDVTIATITVQNYFRLYDKLSGMTGTALTQAEEFDEVYKLDVVAIPTNVEFRASQGELEVRKGRVEDMLPSLVTWEDIDSGVQMIGYYEPRRSDRPVFFQRVDFPDQVYISVDAKFNAVAQEIAHLHQKGRPVLVGTGSVEASEVLSARLRKMGLEHAVLNAKNHDREALIVAQAGRPGAITISTSMAGRGTDILLGGNPEGLAAKYLAEKTFGRAALQAVVAAVVAGDIAKARKEATSAAHMDESVVDWVQAAYRDLVRKAEVEDILQEIVQELQHDPAYSGVPYETLVSLIQQVDLAGIDYRRLDKARQIAESMGAPLSLIPEIEYRLAEYRSLRGLLGQSGLVDTLTRRLFEQHYNARAALIRAVLAGDLEEAQQITSRIPALSPALIRDIQAIQEECQAARQQVWEAGGLHVIGTERHEARRIDNQLRGRAARQGDPGSSRFFLSMEDDLVVRFGGERAKRMMERLNIPEDMPISANILSNAIEQWQSRFEGYYFDIRKNLIEYDEAVNRQRQIVYDERRAILEGESGDLDALVRDFIAQTLERLMRRLGEGYEEWAMGEIQSVLTDFSNFETGEVNTRGVLLRVQPLLPRLGVEQAQDLLSITDSEDLSEALHELVLEAIEMGHNMRMLYAEIARVVPVWPVLPAIGPQGVPGWEQFVKRTVAYFDRYAVELPEDQREAARQALEEGLGVAYRDLLVDLGRGAKPSDTQARFFGQLGTTLGQAFQAILAGSEPEHLIEALLVRVDELLELARQPVDGRDDGAGEPGRQAEALLYGIGAEEIANYERALMLSVIDAEWRQYLNAIDDLRQGIGLEAFGQRDPKVEFKRRAFDMFEKLREDVQEGIARRFFAELPYHRQVVEQQKQQEALLDTIAKSGYRLERKVSQSSEGQVKVSQTVRKDLWSNVGRNDPCPCGSGKKFKDCHYRQVRQQQQTVQQDAIVRTPGGSKRRRRRR